MPHAVIITMRVFIIGVAALFVAGMAQAAYFGIMNGVDYALSHNWI